MKCQGRFAQLVPVSLFTENATHDFPTSFQNAERVRSARTRKLKTSESNLSLVTQYVEYPVRSPFKIKFACDARGICKAQCDRREFEYAGPWVTPLYGSEAALAVVKCGALGSVVTSVRKSPATLRAENVQFFRVEDLADGIGNEISLKRDFVVDENLAAKFSLPATLPWDEELIEFKWKCDP